MFLLDTMIPSELRKGRGANPGVRRWVEQTDSDLQYLSVVSIVEMRRGALQVQTKDAAQSRRLHEWLDHLLLGFQRRVLPINQAVAEQCAILQVPAATNSLDVFIAATALVHNFTLVTRNVRHFDHTGVRVLNPFT